MQTGEFEKNVVKGKLHGLEVLECHECVCVCACVHMNENPCGILPQTLHVCETLVGMGLAGVDALKLPGEPDVHSPLGIIAVLKLVPSLDPGC